MKTKLFAIAVVAFALSGCMNCYVRCPGTNTKITTTYQSTRDMFVWSYVVMFPQVMSDNPGDESKLYPENIITIPIGALCFVDDACECVLDTVFWPFDAWFEHLRIDVKQLPLM